MSASVPKIVIQRAGLRDYDKLCSLFKSWNAEQVQNNPQLYREVENGIGRCAYLGSVWGQRKVFMMALNEKKCVGVSAIEKIDRPDFRASGGEYSVTIMVSPELRRSGIGERLLNATLAQVRGADVSCRLPRGSLAAEPFFTNSGFRVSRVIYGKVVSEIAGTTNWRDFLARPDEANVLSELLDSDQRNIARATRLQNQKFYPLPSMVETFNATRNGHPRKGKFIIFVKRGEDGVSIDGMCLAHQRIVDEQTWYRYPKIAVIDAVAIFEKNKNVGDTVKTADSLVECAAAWAFDKGCSYLRHERLANTLNTNGARQWYGGLSLEGVRMNYAQTQQPLRAIVLD